MNDVNGRRHQPMPVVLEEDKVQLIHFDNIFFFIPITRSNFGLFAEQEQ